MKAVSYTILFAILSPGLLLLVPSVFKAILRNPLSFLAVLLNIALFYLALTNIKYIPYLNTLEAFQDTSATAATSNIPPQNEAPPNISTECVNCVKKANLFLTISTCESKCMKSMNDETCTKCISDNSLSILKSHCSSLCPENIIKGNSS